MKLITLALLSITLFTTGAFASDVLEEKEVIVGLNDVYVPGGFDGDSEVYVVASGLFPNSCYRWVGANVEQNKKSLVYEVKSKASVAQGMCLAVIVPFTKEIRLGKLGTGTHKVHFMAGDGTYIEKKIELE